MAPILAVYLLDAVVIRSCAIYKEGDSQCHYMSSKAYLSIYPLVYALKNTYLVQLQL